MKRGKKMKTIEIKNVCFEVKKSVQKMNGYSDLNDCYKSCSSAKWHAWNFWKNFVKDLNEINFHGVSSHNCNFFSLCFDFMLDGKKAYCHITPFHNYIEIMQN